MPFTEDLSVFFQTAEFADAATLDGTAVNGIFRHGYLEVISMAAHDASFQCAESAATAAATQTSVLVVRGVSYRVRVVQPDGTGVCTLLLESPTP